MNTIMRAKAIDYLSKRDHTRFELQNKLSAKQFDSNEIKTLLDALTAEGLQDDARVAENYVRQRRQNGFGPERISYELEIRGVSKKIIAEKVNPHAIEWRRHMASLIERRYADDHTIDPAEKIRFLISRGYAQAEIFRYLNIEGLEEYD